IVMSINKTASVCGAADSESNTLSLHDALPISIVDIARLSSFRGDLADAIRRSHPNLLNGGPGLNGFTEDLPLRNDPPEEVRVRRSEEHTSELQSRGHLVCRLLLEKKQTRPDSH